MMRQQWIRDSDGRQVVISEAEPGIIRTTTEAMAQLLTMAGFRQLDGDESIDLLRERLSRPTPPPRPPALPNPVQPAP